MNAATYALEMPSCAREREVAAASRRAHARRARTARSAHSQCRAAGPLGSTVCECAQSAEARCTAGAGAQLPNARWALAE